MIEITLNNTDDAVSLLVTNTGGEPVLFRLHLSSVEPLRDALRKVAEVAAAHQDSFTEMGVGSVLQEIEGEARAALESEDAS